MRRANSRLKPLIAGIVAAEMFFFWVAGYLGKFMFLDGNLFLAQYLIFQACLFLGLFGFRAYDSLRLKDRLASLFAATEGMLFGGLLGAATLMTQFPRIPRASFIQAFLIQLAFVLLIRVLLAPHFLPRKRRQGVFVIGDRRWESLMHEIGEALGMEFDPLGFIPPQHITSFSRNCSTRNYLVVLADTGSIRERELHESLFSLGSRIEAIEILPNLAERALGRVPHSVALEFWTHYEVALNQGNTDPLQRLFDILLCVPGLLLGLPAAVVATICLLIETGLPLFTTLERIGLEGQPIRIRRFRTTHPSLHDPLSNHSRENQTRVGRVLKFLHLDAYPLLWDVFTGRLSLVGPSPAEAESYELRVRTIPFYRYGSFVRPGITGLGKLRIPNPSSEEEIRKHLEFDLYYVLHRSPFLDLQILAKTLGLVFSSPERQKEAGRESEEPVILHLAKGYWPTIGGMETVVRQLAEGAVRRGYRVRVLCYGQEDETVWINGVEVNRVHPTLRVGGAPIVLGYSSKFQNLLKDADILHFHCPNPMAEWSAVWLPQGTFKEKAVIATYHSDPLRPKWALPPYRLLLKSFLGKCHFLAATSPAYRLSSEFLKPHREYCRVIPLGIGTARFADISEERIRQVESLISPLGHPRVLFVGRLVYYKGIDILLKALALVPELHGIIVGQGPLSAELKSLAQRLGLKNRVCFLGFLSDELYPAVYRCADIFALPSVARTEAFGIVALEAMASGLPLVTTELSTGTSYHNRHQETGFVIPPGDPLALGDSLRVLLQDPESCKHLGTNGNARVVRHFEEGKMVQSYLDLYEEASRKTVS